MQGVSASRATSSDTPAISNITLPGLTTATQPSGAPLPEPIRTSRGFCCIWFMRENFDPYFTATFHVTCHCNTCSFDLTVCNP